MNYGLLNTKNGAVKSNRTQKMHFRKWKQIFQLGLKKIILANQKTRQRLILSQLDDPILDDIGVTRQQAVDESKKSFWE